MKQTSLSIWVLVTLISAFFVGMGIHFGQRTAEWMERKISDGSKPDN